MLVTNLTGVALSGLFFTVERKSVDHNLANIVTEDPDEVLLGRLSALESRMIRCQESLLLLLHSVDDLLKRLLYCKSG